jgi:hypothetical protein
MLRKTKGGVLFTGDFEGQTKKGSGNGASRSVELCEGNQEEGSFTGKSKATSDMSRKVLEK